MADLDIKTVGGNGSFDDVIATAPPEIQALARAARELLADVMPGITEVPGRVRDRWIRHRTEEDVAAFLLYAPFKRHLNFGFMYGAHLPDPQNLLEGSGADLRHVKIRKAADLEQAGLRELVAEASRYLPKLR